MKEGARNGETAFTILKWAGGSFGVAVITAFAVWMFSGGMNKKSDTAPSRINPAMIGPPSPK